MNEQQFQLTEVTNKTNSVVLVRKRTIPTERPPHVGEVGVTAMLFMAFDRLPFVKQK
jgi:hypothetical protein